MIINDTLTFTFDGKYNHFIDVHHFALFNFFLM